MKRKILSSFLVTFVLVVGLSLTSNANTVTVTNTSDTGAGSLRDALLTAVDGDTIDFNLTGCPCTITLTSGTLTLDKTLFITGPGADQLTISGNNAQTVFIVPTGPPHGITISGLTIANGKSTSNGGGILINSGPMTISNCVLTGNSAPTTGSNNGNGGAIYLSSGTLSIINSTISNNSCAATGAGIGMPVSGGLGETLITAGSTFSQNNATGSGGAVSVPSTGTMTSANCSFMNNTAGVAGAIACSGMGVVRGGTITLNHATAIGGGASQLGGGGIAIDTTGVVEMEGVFISNNDTAAADHGGGIWNKGGTVSVSQCVISNNKADDGGGIYSSGPLTVADSTISGNMAVSTVAGPTGGGGIKSSSTATVSGSTISGNSATSAGGGIFSTAPMTLTNSTVSGNQVTALAGSGKGGGIDCGSGGTASLTNCTIALNTAPNNGGGVRIEVAGTTVNVSNTIIALNTGSPTSEREVSGTFVSQGFNLIGSAPASTGFVNGTNGDIVGAGAGINPMLAPLADNGGPTQTHALQTGSPAIDKGNSPFGITTDQRGQPRFVDVATVANVPGSNFSDIGAYETIPLELTDAASRKTHGVAGTFDIDMPLTGSSGIEDRSGGGAYTIVLKFSNTVTAGNAAVTAGAGTVSGVSFNNKEMLVSLSGVANAQVLTLSATNVADTGGQVLGAAGVNVGFLIGDANGNRSVNATDVSQTKLQSGTIVTAANFREDINASGSINATDVAQAKGQSGTSVPLLRGRDSLLTSRR